MSSSRPALRVCFLPDASVRPPGLLQAVESAGLVCVPLEEADVILWDARGAQSPSGPPPLDRSLRLPTVVLVSGEGPFEAAVARVPGGTDFVTAEASAGELVARLWQARSRQAALNDAERREKDLSLLLKVTADYAGSLDVATLLHDVTRMLAEALDIARVAVLVLGEQQEVGYVIAASDDAKLEHIRLDLSRYPEVQEAARTGRPVVLNDAPSHPLLEEVKERVVARGIRALAALPLTASGKVLGVLLVRASERRPGFQKREIDFLATVAHATGVALRNAHILETVRGQTEREKHARIAAEEKAAGLQLYESYFEHVSDGIAVLERNGRLLMLNPAGATLLSLTAEQARGRHFRTLVNAKDEARFHEALEAVAHGSVRELDVQVRTPGAKLLTLSVSAAPLGRSDGAAIVAFRDVTTQRRLADELEKTNHFLERLIDSSADAIIAADMRGKIILFNKGAEEICGYSAKEALASLHVRQLYLHGGAERIMKRLRDPNDGGGRGRLRGVRQEILTRSGDRVPVLMTASIVFDGDREVATLGIFTDIRERVNLEKKLMAAEDRLGEAERSAVIVALAGAAAHELNQPLTSVMGYAELLRRRLSEDDPARRPSEIIYREAERMAEIVRKIGKITRYETKAYVGEAQILDLDKASSHEE